LSIDNGVSQQQTIHLSQWFLIIFAHLKFNMIKQAVLLTILITLSFFCNNARGQQQDVEFHLNSHLLTGQKVLKVKCDFNDIYLWVLTANNHVYRVNSQTQAIDDYSSAFAAYNNLQFIDIVGRSQDTVFVATNSANVIEYKKGIIKDIGSADGIPGIVNSIGMSTDPQSYLGLSGTSLMIASKNGFIWYDVKTEKTKTDNDPTGNFYGDSKVYEATYRTQVFKDSTSNTIGYSNTTDTIKYQPVIDVVNITTYVEFLWEGSKFFGSPINTATGIYSNSYNEISVNHFWGTDRGLFENYGDFSYWSVFESPFHYLDGIKVNKIADIYGLMAFQGYYNNGYISKQNLLVGTDQGLYFSSSFYTEEYGYLPLTRMFHYDELGNDPINDICVNHVLNSKPICEDGVWIGANDGLYLIKPDYAAFINSQQLNNTVKFVNQPDTTSQLQVCSGTPVSAWVNNRFNNPVIWYKDDVEIPGASKDTLAITLPGDYNAVMYGACENIHLETNHLKVNFVSAPVFTFNYPDTLKYCGSAYTTLNVTYSPAYHYRWYTDGTLNGDTTSKFTATQSGSYYVEVSACTNSWVPSKQVQVNFIQIPQPVITTDKPTYCNGDNATLSLSTAPSTLFTVNWYRDNVLLSDDKDKTALKTNIAGNYSAVVTSNAAATDGNICAQTSAIVPISFNAQPTLTIQQQINTTLCEGQTVTLKAIHSDGTLKWSTGETSDYINVSESGTYTVAITTTSGCTANANTKVTFVTNPQLNISDATICPYQHVAVTLTAPDGFAQYAWNNIPGNHTFNVTSAQTVTLTVTDVNGCQATRQIHITEQCAEVFLPNTFTPNGDGINDVWNIQGLDATASVSIFNRYGTMIYHSKGYAVAWYGTYHNQKLPAGTYYYLINAKNNSQTFSGPVTILY